MVRLFDRPLICPFDQGHAHGVVFIPLGFASLLRHSVLGIVAPVGNRLEAGPVRHGDAKAVSSARALLAQKTWLVLGQLDHALCHGGVARVSGRAQAGENYRVVGRGGKRGEG